MCGNSGPAISIVQLPHVAKNVNEMGDSMSEYGPDSPPPLDMPFWVIANPMTCAATQPGGHMPCRREEGSAATDEATPNYSPETDSLTLTPRPVSLEVYPGHMPPTQPGRTHALSSRRGSAATDEATPNYSPETDSLAFAPSPASLVSRSFGPRHRHACHARHEYSRWSPRGAISPLVDEARMTIGAIAGGILIAIAQGFTNDARPACGGVPG